MSKAPRTRRGASASRARPAPARAPEPAPPAAPVRAPERRREVLVAALELMAEQGYAGASLRKLADKLGMRQPSLYHYFRSKEDLVEQVIHTFAADMMEVSLQHLPQRLEEVPAWVRDSVLALYERPTHPLFVRVLFSISRSHPRYGKLMRELFVDRVDMAIRLFAQPFVARGDIGERDAVYLARMAINAIGLKLMEERVLFDEQPIHADVRAYADFVVENMELLLRARAARRRATPRARRGAGG